MKNKIFDLVLYMYMYHLQNTLTSSQKLACKLANFGEFLFVRSEVY